MHRLAWIVLGALILAALALSLLLRDTSTPVDFVTVGQAFEGVAGESPGDPGVYSYSTDGFEEIDALAGARHEYPAVTYMTITPGSCGPVVHWQPLQERFIEWHHCGPEFAVTETIEGHEWFGVPDEESERCDTPRPVFGDAAEIICIAADSTETYRVELVGVEPAAVGGVSVDTVHVRRISSVSGTSQGETTVDEWRLVGTPLIVRMDLTGSSATSSAIGEVMYTEQFTLSLLDLVPTG